MNWRLAGIVVSILTAVGAGTLQAQTAQLSLAQLLREAVPHLQLDPANVLFVDTTSLRATAITLNAPTLAADNLVSVFGKPVIPGPPHGPSFDHVKIDSASMTGDVLKLFITVRGTYKSTGNVRRVSSATFQVTYASENQSWRYKGVTIVVIE